MGETKFTMDCYFCSYRVVKPYIAYNFSLNFWVNIKVFGLMGVTFVCIFITIMVLFKYVPDDEKTATSDKKNPSK